MKIARGLFAALVTVAIATAAVAQNQNEPGKFDFYVLALSWTPSYCEAEGDRRGGDEQCNRGRPYSFVVHGLWPQYERGFPNSCVTPAPWVASGLIRSMLDLMPARGLIVHEWRTHGTCSGLGPENYFNAVGRAVGRGAKTPRSKAQEKKTQV
jgi:ribonuclease T2